ncbi:MAG: thioredoxin family protein [Cytophagales bacterium]
MVHHASDADFNKHLADHENVVVKYFADWCGTCKLFAPKFRRLSEEDRFTNITFIEINAEESPEARKIAGVNNLPFVATFKKGELFEAYATGKEEAVLEMLGKL